MSRFFIMAQAQYHGHGPASSGKYRGARTAEAHDGRFEADRAL
jgi:hypothetical protein